MIKQKSKLDILRMEARPSQSKLARLDDLDRKIICDLENRKTSSQDANLEKISQTLSGALNCEITNDAFLH